eukprot:3747791-Karenia_brevis.AAC.1
MLGEISTRTYARPAAAGGAGSASSASGGPAQDGPVFTEAPLYVPSQVQAVSFDSQDDSSVDATPRKRKEPQPAQT